MHQEDNIERLLVVGDADTLSKAGVSEEYGREVEVVDSLEEAAHLREVKDFSRIIIDPAALRAAGFEVLHEEECIHADEVEEKNKHLQELFDSAPIGMALFDVEPPYKVLAHNKVYQEFLPEPFKSQGVVGKYIPDYIPDIEESGILEVFRRTAETKEPQTIYEFPYDGMPRGRTWWNWSLAPVIRDDEVVNFSHILVDITDQVLARKQVEVLVADREQARAQLDAIVSSMNDGLIIADIQGNILRMNPAALNILGYSSTEDVKTHIEEYRKMWDVKYPDGTDMPVDEWPLSRVIRGEVLSGYEIFARDLRTGREVFASYSGSLVYSPSGEPILAVLTLRDITDQKRAEQKLRDSQQLLYSIIDNASAAIYVKDLEGRLVLVNKNLSNLLQIPKEQMIGKTSYDFYPKEVADQHVANDQQVMQIGEPISSEEIVPEDDQVRTFISQKFPFKNSKGEIRGVGGISTEITARKRAEEALMLSHKRFELLADVAAQLLSADAPEKMIGPLGKRALGYLDCDFFVNYLYKADKKSLYLNSHYGIPEATARTVGWLNCGDIACGVSAGESCRFVAENIPESTDPRVEFSKSLGLKSYSCHQLLSHTGDVIGMLAFGSRSRSEFTEDQLAMMKSLAYQFAIAVERSRLYIAERQRAEEAEEGQRILDALMEHVPEGITIVGGPPEFQIQRVSKHGQELTGRSMFELQKFPIGKHMKAWGLLLADGSEPRPEQLPLYRSTRFGEIVGNEEWMIERPDGTRLPILVNCAPIKDERGRITGGVIAWRNIEERKRAEEELTRTRKEAQDRAAQLEAWLASMADGVVFTDANKQVVLMNEAGRRMLGMTEDEPLSDVYNRFRWYSLDNEPLSFENTASFSAMSTGQVVRDVRYKVVNQKGREIVISVSAAPVRDAQGWIAGATAIFRDVSDRVQFEMQREALLERERHIAEVLQEALVPPSVPKRVSDYEIAVRYEPALREAEIGGDFYDVFEVADGKIGILIGDIAGKGLGAAIRVAAARYAIRSYAYLDPKPSTVMTLANEALCKEIPESSGMLTAFLAVLDVYTGEFCYTSAGHEPPLGISSQGDIVELEPGGVPFGVTGGFAYPEDAVILKKGDRIVMMTDGITEARAEGNALFGKEGVLEFLCSAFDQNAEQIAAGLLESARAYANGQLQDDVAIVVIERVSEECRPPDEVSESCGPNIT